MQFDLIIRNGTRVFPWGEESVGNIGVKDGRITGFDVPASAQAAREIDARGLHVLPGLMDAHTHLREPGKDHVETIATGTAGAALGGLTAVFDMPNTNPAVVSAERLAWKRRRIEETACIDVGMYVGATRENARELGALEELPGVCGVKVFAGSSTGDLLIEDDAGIRAVLENGRRRVSFHSEDDYRLRERAGVWRLEGKPAATHAVWRDEECAFLGTRRIVALARETGRPVHILHVSTAQELKLLAASRDLASVEILGNHLTLFGPDCYEALGGRAVMNPPLRDRAYYEAAWAAVRNGLVDVVGSDHAPHPLSEKEKPWPACPSGLPGVQTIVPLMLDHVNQGRLTLGRLADLMSAGPARIYGIMGKGRLARGYDADFTLVDMKAPFTVRREALASPSGWSPYEGRSLAGRPVFSIVRGRVVMEEGEIVSRTGGRIVRFFP